MKSNIIKYKILLVFFSILLSTFSAFSKEEIPEPPDDFTVTSHIANFGLFKWKVHQSAGIRGFIVYYHIGNSEEISEFEILDTVSVTDPNLKFENGFHSIFLHVTKGEYSFFITAFNLYGESEPSDIVFKTMGENEVKIYFTTRADTIGFVGEKYEYEARAKASTGALIKYKIKSGPQGMVIDQNTGKLSWAPKEEGRYLIIIHAYLALNPVIFLPQDWNIVVKKCKKESIISGTIKYQNGENVESGIVKIYKKSQQTEPDLFSKIEFSNGTFSKEVDEGIYYLRYEGEKIIPEWYEDVYILAEAKPVQVKCGEEKNISAVVDKYIPKEYYKISGKVTRESDGSPVPFAPIQFFGRNGQSEEAKDGTSSNNEGYYEKTLQGNYNYIVSFPAWGNYLTQFYDKADNLSEATVIELNSNRENIDFVLKEKPTFANKISGIVKDENGIAIPEINVIAFRVFPEPLLNVNYISYNAKKTDNSGNFKLENLETGKYILLVFTPNIRKVPGYYKENSMVIRTWRDASRIDIGEHTIKEEIIIKVPILPVHESGRGIISGVITQGETFMVSSQVLKEGDPIAGAIVFALDQNSNVRNFAFTDDLGRYEMRSMTAGKYKISADKVGYYPFNTDVELIEDNSTVNNNVELYTIVGDVTNNEQLKIELYPNPVSDFLHFNTKEFTNKINFTIFNSLGLELSSNIFDSDNSQDGIKINVSKFNTGFYYLRIESGLFSGTYPFVISR